MANVTVEPKVYSISECAAQLRKSRQWVSKAIKRGEVPGGLRLGTRTVVRRSTFDRWLAGLDPLPNR